MRTLLATLKGITERTKGTNGGTPEGATAGIAYSFCESVSAGPVSPRHIRLLSAAGMKKSGGADTVALCGREVAWDVQPVTAAIVLYGRNAWKTGHDTARVCLLCADAYDAI